MFRHATLFVFLTFNKICLTCRNEIDIDRSALYDIVWDIYDYVSGGNASRDAANHCVRASTQMCTTVVLQGMVQLWGRRPKGDLKQKTRRGPGDGEWYYGSRVNVSRVRYSTCDYGIVFKGANWRRWRTNLCGYLWDQFGDQGGRKQSVTHSSHRPEAYEYCYTWVDPFAMIFGTSDFISKVNRMRAGFRMALLYGRVDVHCCAGSIDCNGYDPPQQPCLNIPLLS